MITKVNPGGVFSTHASRLPRELPALMIPARITGETLKYFFGRIMACVPPPDVTLLLERPRLREAAVRVMRLYE